jgi:hypothetical protein
VFKLIQINRISLKATQFLKIPLQVVVSSVAKKLSIFAP